MDDWFEKALKVQEIIEKRVPRGASFLGMTFYDDRTIAYSYDWPGAETDMDEIGLDELTELMRQERG